MFSKNFSRETGFPGPAKLFRKRRRATCLSSPPSLSAPARPPEPEHQPRHKAEGQRGEPLGTKEVNHVRTQTEGHQSSGNLPRPSRLRGHRRRVEVRGRRLHRRGGARRGRDRVLRRAGPQGREKGIPEESLGASERMEVNAAKRLGQHGDDPDNVDVAIRFDQIAMLVIGEDRALLRHYINCLGSGTIAATTE